MLSGTCNQSPTRHAGRPGRSDRWCDGNTRGTDDRRAGTGIRPAWIADRNHAGPGSRVIAFSDGDGRLVLRRYKDTAGAIGRHRKPSARRLRRGTNNDLRVTLTSLPSVPQSQIAWPTSPLQGAHTRETDVPAANRSPMTPPVPRPFHPEPDRVRGRGGPARSPRRARVAGPAGDWPSRTTSR